jgi:hypothetical protein
MLRARNIHGDRTSRLTSKTDSGGRTFLQRGSPPPPPWRLLSESFSREFGYELMKRVVMVAIQRLHAAREQLLDRQMGYIFER